MELDKENLLKLYPDYDSVLGPYSREDGRKQIVLNNTELPSGSPGKLKTISYPKALVESTINRRLTKDETIDHNDRDKTNDNLNNLVIRNRNEHSRLDAIHVSVEPVNCVECGKSFEPSKAQRNSQAFNRESEPAGPFCSKHCSGLYGARVQNGGERLERQVIKKTYCLKDK